MAYALYIERPESPITTSEWIQAIEATDGIRIAPSEACATVNPTTGERLGMTTVSGDADVFDHEDGQWHFGVRWSEKYSQGTFNARIVSRATDGDPAGDPIWTALTSVARMLQAQIGGDNGETYDLVTARPKMG